MLALLASACLMSLQTGGGDVLAEVAQIPTFLDEYRVVVQTDRVSIVRTRDGRRSVVGTGSPRADAGPTFATYFTEHPDMASRLGPALSISQTGFNGALVYQLFDGGLLVKETATTTIWPLTHPRRNAGPRPPGEIIRRPSFGLFSKDYDFTAFQDRIEIRQAATNRVESAFVRSGPFAISPFAAKSFQTDANLEKRLGLAVSPETRFFDGELVGQAFLGGVVLYESSTKRTWYSWHPHRPVPADRPGPTLPDNPSANILTFDWRGGYTPPRVNVAPYLTIRADGLATLVDPFGKRPTVQARYDQRQLRELLDFIVREHRFFDLDSDRLAADIRKGPRILDAGTSVLRVSTANRTHEVRCHAAVPYAEALPQMTDLQHFAAIERRLIREMDRLQAARP